MRFELEATVRAAPETVFATLADLGGYGDWLPPSGEYHGTTEVTPGSVAAGTSYVEHSPTGTRRGEITEYAPVTRLAFRQTMALAPAVLGEIDIAIRYRLRPDHGGTGVTRMVWVGVPARTRVLRPLIRRRFRAESRRTLDALAARFAAGDPHRG